MLRTVAQFCVTDDVFQALPRPPAHCAYGQFLPTQLNPSGMADVHMDHSHPTVHGNANSQPVRVPGTWHITWIEQD